MFASQTHNQQCIFQVVFHLSQVTSALAPGRPFCNRSVASNSSRAQQTTKCDGDDEILCLESLNEVI
ncbi:hypothetical protein PR048_029922 [Dryococelus australis]|uniref:Uncharacterized protein n=1 Tax=Dryococelus australis TaxID=614101 RepID=A0ABQ9GA64_9NEOP|nr:hypothetical protein PR048_029922 [Dryococelus australis]